MEALKARDGDLWIDPRHGIQFCPVETRKAEPQQQWQWSDVRQVTVRDAGRKKLGGHALIGVLGYLIRVREATVLITDDTATREFQVADRPDRVADILRRGGAGERLFV